jgi:DNA mismatch repair protein MutS2
LPAQQTRLADPLSLDALETIEFAAVLDLVAAFAAGEGGAERVRQLRPSADLAWVAAELALVEEVTALYRRGDRIEAEPVPELAQSLKRLRVEGSVLDAAEVAAIAQLLRAAHRVREELQRVRESAPMAGALAVTLPSRDIDRRLERSVGPDGQVLDSASPAIAAARREAQDARQQLVRRLEGILRSIDPSGGAAEGTVTVRGGRYVIPVRRDLRTRPDGIVHDESASAETLFIEPSATVQLGNALREALVAEERETLRVLRELSAVLRPELPLLSDALEMCLQVDALVARARWAHAAEGNAPSVTPAPAALRIRNGRHPLLLASGNVVPFDLELVPDEHTLLVSGPNTGGKTVLLKAVALFVALAQSGIIPPMAPGGALPLVHRLAADIGDRQSIAASLSTFSAHVRTLGAILRDADDATLVLLDEIGSGTDPAEGAALAAAAITSLTRRGALTLATTHLGQLKTLAAEEPGVVNASLEFDAATLAPTYRFRKGVPGRSYGLAIARRLGIGADVLDDAEARVPAAERSFDALLTAVEERQRDVEQRERTAHARAAEQQELSERLAAQQAIQQAKGDDLARREKESERRARDEARRFLLEARKTVEAALQEARGAADEVRARDARRGLEDAIREQGDALATFEPPPADAAGDAVLTVGQRVRTTAGLEGVLLERRADDKALIRVGSMKMTVPLAQLAPGKASSATHGRAPAGSSSPVDSESAVPMELDLRGMTGDEAESATLAAIDAAVVADYPIVRIIHGMGTGVVRERVRRVVQHDRRVRKFDFAPRNQGGVGVTIVELA